MHILTYGYGQNKPLQHGTENNLFAHSHMTSFIRIQKIQINCYFVIKPITNNGKYTNLSFHGIDKEKNQSSQTNQPLLSQLPIKLVDNSKKYKFTINTKSPVVGLYVKLLLAKVVSLELEVGMGWSFLCHEYVGLGSPESKI